MGNDVTERADEIEQLFGKIAKHIAIMGNEIPTRDYREAAVYIDAGCERIRFLCSQIFRLDNGGMD